MSKLQKLILEVLNKPIKKSCSCGCNTCGDKAPILNENKQYDYPISIHMRYHLDNKIPLHDTKFIVGSNQYKNFINEAKLLAKKDIIKLKEEDEKFINNEITADNLISVLSKKQTPYITIEFKGKKYNIKNLTFLNLKTIDFLLDNGMNLRLKQKDKIKLIS